MGVEGFVTAIVDLFPNHLRRGYRKEMFIGLMCIIWFLFGLSMVTKVIINDMRIITINTAIMSRSERNYRPASYLAVAGEGRGSRNTPGRFMLRKLK